MVRVLRSEACYCLDFTTFSSYWERDGNDIVTRLDNTQCAPEIIEQMLVNSCNEGIVVSNMKTSWILNLRNAHYPDCRVTLPKKTINIINCKKCRLKHDQTNLIICRDFS